ncbi:MAG: ATP synthase subunit I [Pseudomonadota bacterium]
MRIVAMQVAVGLLVAVSLYILRGWEQAYAALVGAMIGVLPSYYLGNRIFGAEQGASGDDLLRQIYVAEMMKLGFTVALFLISILLLDVEFTIVLCTYAAVVAVNWLAMKFTDLGVKAPAQSSDAS